MIMIIAIFIPVENVILFIVGCIGLGVGLSENEIYFRKSAEERFTILD